MTQTPTMQDVIRRLNDYWVGHGCLLWHPYSEKVGAGTMNPATVLRVLGPEPWNVAYVEPSFRADDGRYAENPNRMQMHNQYQVILKPDPGNPQELYLGSLAAIGLDPTRHDIRFVEDNWESPALGAWGLGWEVWLDGQEITQYTYFQQAGGFPLEPVSVEITYGLDRIVMYLQNKTEVWSIDVDANHTFGDLYRPAEIEHCVYNFELADVDRLKTLFDIYQAEAMACIERGLVVPAHDFVLRQSHTFNLLDARGAIGVTERAKFFAAMRNQARKVSELYLKQRESEEYPWLVDTQSRQESNGDAQTTGGQTSPSQTTSPASPQQFVLELGSEELPPHDVVEGCRQIGEKLAQLLQENRLGYEKLHVTGTTRRLVATVEGLAIAQSDETVEKRGPALDRAFDADGNPTRAVEGFAKGQGVAVANLEQRDGYVYAIQTLVGQPTVDVLPKLCIDLLNSLRWGKAMRWNATGVTYPRPLRWIVALYGDQIMPFEWGNVQSGRISRGPRFADTAAGLQPGEFTTFAVETAGDYPQAIAAQGVLLDREERRATIARMVAETAARVQGESPTDDDLLDEVTDLVEAPQALLGRFEAEFLALPRQVLIGVMKKHQRYFPIFREGELLPHFITIANSRGLAHPEVVIAGNEGVIRARYADAAFFHRQDTTRPLESFTPRLGTLTFHERLGSMLDKAQRLETLAPAVGEMLNLYGKQADAETIDATTLETVKRAAALSKSDLVTSMVVEMTSLQGIMGEIYARRSGETEAVAQAIREHYLPRAAGDDAPASPAGLILGLADKLDSIIGLFAVGAIPTGSADPFGLRRAALGIVNNLLVAEKEFSLRAGLAAAARVQPVEVTETAQQEALTFIVRRLQGVLAEEGFSHDIIDAVLAVRGDNPAAALRACRALQSAVREPGWEAAFTAYARAARITRTLETDLTLDPAAYAEAVEHALHDAYRQAQSRLESAAEPAEVWAQVVQELTAPITEYFESVLVNAEDETLRNARLALVQHIARLPGNIADLSKLQGF